MSIQAIRNFQLCAAKYKASEKKTAVGKLSTPKQVEDTYTPSDDEDRKKVLSAIKQKINEGFYNSPEVTEDLSDAFAKVFNAAIQ